MSKTAIISLIFLALVAVLVVTSLTGVHEVTCEVCITFNGQTVCRTGQGRTREDAQRTATESACAMLATGMDQRIECGKTEPSSMSCEE